MNSKALARSVREQSLHMVHRAKASHIGSALSIADILAVLYARVMNFDAAQPDAQDRDRFILSKGHACAALYATLAEIGCFPKAELKEYGRDFSRLMNHASHHVPGVEFSTGSLGHGLPFAVGKALAAKMGKHRWRVFALLSDGELDEGSNWEAFMFAAHHRLDNLTAIIDYNNLQSLDTVANTLGLEPLRDKLMAFNWRVIEVDGHDHLALEEAIAGSSQGQPTVVIANTTKGKGVSYMENQVLWHYRNPDDELLAKGLRDIARASEDA